jgi:hypothetical protein
MKWMDLILVNVNNISLLVKVINIKKDPETLLDASTEVGLEKGS